MTSETLRDVNTRLLGHTDLERHCTLVYAQLRPTDEGSSVVFTLAGHHPPLVLRATGIVEETGSLGTALGLFEEPDLQDTTLHLAPGDLLCVFTDGLVEARSDGEMFGAERVADVIRQHQGRPVGEIATLLVEAAHDFHGPQLADDLAILLIRHGRGAG